MEKESILEIIRVMEMRAIRILIDLVNSVSLMIIIRDTIYSFLSLKCYTARVSLQLQVSNVSQCIQSLHPCKNRI